MNQNDFSNLNFDRPRNAIPARLIWVAALGISFSLAWMMIPHPVLFWILLLLVGILGWAASYGWRQALRILVAGLNRIQNL